MDSDSAASLNFNAILQARCMTISLIVYMHQLPMFS